MMADPRFFSVAGPFSAGDLADRAGAKVDGDSARMISGAAPLETASADDLSFFDNPKFRQAFAGSRAGAAVVHPKDRGLAPQGMVLLISETPHKAFALASQALYPEPEPTPGISGAAHVSPSAVLGAGCAVADGAVVGAAADLGAGCVIGANAVVGPGVVLGRKGRVGAGATLSHCLIGARVNIYPGARIGQDGFGFAPDAGGHVKVPQVGRVMIGDDCEIGANAAIDRGSSADTEIGANCWIDNLVHIGHNVRLGRGVIVAGLCGIAGSTVVEDFVAIGGRVGISGHLRIGAGAQIAGGSGVIRDVPAGEVWAGYPAVPIRQWHRQSAALARDSKSAARARESKSAARARESKSAGLGRGSKNAETNGKAEDEQ